MVVIVEGILIEDKLLQFANTPVLIEIIKMAKSLKLKHYNHQMQKSL